MQSITFLDFQTFQLIIKVSYAAVLFYGCVWDIRRLQIPNAVSLALLALFFVNYALLPWPERLAPHIGAGVVTFLLTFALYAGGLLGAGDVKLISVLMVWGGLKDGPAFLIIMTLIGGLLAGTLLILKQILTRWPAAYRYIPSRRLRNWAGRGIFPYGIAICIAGLILMPSYFARPA